MKKIAINGFGRIGRGAFRSIMASDNLKVVAINELTDNKTLAHLLQYDSVYRKYKKLVSFNKDGLIVDGQEIPVFSEEDPGNLPWKKLDVDVVFECTGVFRKRKDAIKHINAGAKKVIISAPPKSDDIPSFVMGVNENEYKSDQEIISNCSCTTNCLAPVVKVLNDEFGIKNSFFTTIHSYTTTQNILDGPNKKDLRRARAAALNLVPTTTGASQSVIKVIPDLEGKLHGRAIRVPTPNVSLVDLVVQLDSNVETNKINQTFEEKSQSELKGILDIETKPLVSTDYIENSYSAIIDSEFTYSSNGTVKMFIWYDNEYGYSCRMRDLAKHILSVPSN